LQNLLKDLASIDWVYANHNCILKKVCFVGEEFISNITQVAYTELKEGIEVDAHAHISMEEVFFLLEGVCEFKIKGESILAEKQSIIRIPVNQEHSLRAISDCKLFYFGVSI
jgi:mannose-6-phosphate isomerase-like protein (cupin superfamily)